MPAFASHEARLDWLYKEYCLAGIWMRQAPDYIDDNVIAFHLLKCGEEQSLPWEFSDEEFDDIWRKT